MKTMIKYLLLAFIWVLFTVFAGVFLRIHLEVHQADVGAIMASGYFYYAVTIWGFIWLLKKTGIKIDIKYPK